MIICEVCEHEIGNGQAVVHKVIGWIEVKNGKRVGSVMKPSNALGYAHKVCVQLGQSRDDSPTLF